MIVLKEFKVRCKKSFTASDYLKVMKINILKNHVYSCVLYADNTALIKNKDFRLMVSSETFDECFKPIVCAKE